MGAGQMEAIERGIADAYKGISDPLDPPGVCCTFETRNTADEEVWIQVIAGSVNMMYPFDDEPFERLRTTGVRRPQNLDMIDWVANSYATFDVDDVSVRDQAFLVDQLFTKVLGCDDGSYEVAASFEDLEG